MRMLNNIFRVIYSLLVLFISLILIMMVNGIIPVDISSTFMNFVSACVNGKIIFTLVFSLVALLSIVSVFVTDSETDSKKGILMDYETGCVLVTKETFENIAISVTQKYGALRASKVNVDLRDEGLNVNIYTYVMPDTVVSDITLKVQKDIKDTINKLTSVKVNSVNMKIKGIYQQVQKTDEV